MKIKSIKENDKNIFKELSKEFYASGATINPYNDETNEKTFRYLTSAHHNLFGYLIISDDGNCAVFLAYVVLVQRRRRRNSYHWRTVRQKRVSPARIRKTLYQLGGKPLQRTRCRNDAWSAVRQRARNRFVFGARVCARRLYDNDKKNIKASDGKSFLCFRHWKIAARVIQ